MSEIREVNQDGKIEVAETPKEIGTPKSSLSEEMPIENYAIAQFFDIDSKEMINNVEGIETIMKWVKTQTDDLDLMNIKWVLRELEDKLGSPPLTEKRISQVVRYATLDLQSKQIEREKESLLSK